MTRVSDLVQDAELQTLFHPEHTTHIYIETGLTVQQRAILREEHWKRQRKPVGNGSYGNVWLEQCESGHREVKVRAVKEVDKCPHGSKQIDYHRELEAIMKFSHQKYERCFVKSFGWYENDEAIFIAMEYFKHRDLQRHLSSSPPLPESEAQQITFQILEGLHFMHGNRYSHRDLKPGNILVKSMPPDPWWVKLSDFGISKRAADDAAASSTLKGTMRYMAPELFGFVKPGEESDSCKAQAADMWALGEIAFQMLTKEQTFEDMSLLSTYARSPNIFPSTVLRAHDVSEVGINFIKSVMLPRPEERLKADKALLQAWMGLYNSYITRETSIVPVGRAVSEAMPGTPMGESWSNPSGRWSTVSIAATPLLSSTSRSNTASVELSTRNTTVSLSGPSTSMLGSTNKAIPGNSVTQARYFILKSGNETNIETSAAHGIWCCGKGINTRLSNAYNSASGPIFLIFSVNKSRQFCGVAQMKSSWSPNVTTAHWQEDAKREGGFHVEWLSWKTIEFDDVSHLTHKEEDGVSITRGRYVLELCESTGLEMVQRFGLLDLVAQRNRLPSNMSTIGSLAVGRLALATASDTDSSNAFGSTSDLHNEGRRSNSEIRHSNTITAKRPLEMEIDDSEGDKRQRI